MSETPSETEEEQAALEGDSLEEAIAKLTPEQADMFVRALSLTMRKRRLMLVGNLLALLVLVIGMLFAFVAYGNRTPGTFVGWVFLVPLGSAGFCLWFFGKLAKRAGARTHKTLIEPLAGSSESIP
jgi:hypothetical protein